jgi:hypothetical protein
MMDEHDPDLPEAEEAAVEARLRRALEQRAASVQPADGGLTAIEAGVAAERRRRQRRTAVLGLAAGVLVFAAVAAFLNLAGDDDDSVVTDDPTTTTTEGTPSTTTTSTTTVPTTTTTTTTVPIDDDGVQGWPGATSRVFDSPEAAALAFAGDVLGFAEPTLAEGTTEGDDGQYVVHPNPRAAISTRIDVHHTGDLRGWVVTGTTSDQGTIDDVQVNGNGTITITGSATAFEATVTVAVLDLEGNYLSETFTMSGSNGEQGPYTATIGEFFTGQPAFVLIAASDESGEGRLLWATLALVDEG